MQKTSSIDGYPGAVFQYYMNKSGLSYIALVTRKLFDHSNNDSLNGAKFAKTSDCTLKKHAQRWACFSGRPEQDAINALEILHAFCKVFSQETDDLLKEESRLCKRIGLVKQYANREAAHLTLQNYEVTWLDVLHITASMVLVAEIAQLAKDCIAWGEDYSMELLLKNILDKLSYYWDIPFKGSIIPLT
jgi:predicted transcriptional regulator